MDGSTALTDPDVYIAMQFASTALSNPAMRSAILQCAQQPCNALSDPDGALTGPDGVSPP